MPVEIKELVIRMTHAEPLADARPDGSGLSPEAAPNTAAIVEACVKQVLKILEQKKNR